MRRLLATLLVLGPSALAAAQPVRVESPGCPPIAPRVASALRLEAGPGWDVGADDAELVVAVGVSGCDDDAWILTVSDASGAVVSGPEAVAMNDFGEPTRARLAGLWAAEHLGIAPPAAAAESLDAPAPPAPEDPPPPPAVDAGPASPFPRAVLDVGVGAAYLVDPAQLAEAAVRGRVGLSAQILDWLLLGGSLDGGALFEPYQHVQPFFRLCGEPRAELDVGPLRVGIAPKLCASVSRHSRGGIDQWSGGLAVGAAIRATLAVDDGLAVGLRIDADAWDRDLLAGPSPAGVGAGGAVDLPWAGVFGAALELDVR